MPNKPNNACAEMLKLATNLRMDLENKGLKEQAKTVKKAADNSAEI
jgi:hypothetical protein